MAAAIVALGSNAAAAAGNRSVDAWFAGAGFPAWGLFVAVLLVFFVGIAIAQAIQAVAKALPEHKKKHAEFTRMLCDQLWKHTDFVTSVFAQRMRQDPNDTITLHVLVRNLREDLAAPVYFVDQMLSHPPSDWPDYKLFSAFTAWAGQVKSMASQLADVQQALVFPPGKDAADKYREQMLVYKFFTERTIISRGISQLRSDAFTLCDAAKKSLEKVKKKPGYGLRHGDTLDEEGTEKSAGCPCCRHKHEHSVIVQPDHLNLPPLPEAPKAPPPPPPPPPVTTCYCAAPRICHCARCVCSCACAPVPAAKPAA